jgi:amidase
VLEPDDSIGEDEFHVLMHELISDLGNYLQGRSMSRVKSLSDVVAFNLANSKIELEFFGQEFFDQALKLGGRGSAYQAKRDRNLVWANRILDKGLADVDVLIGCTYSPAWISNLEGGDDYDSASWITKAPSIAGAPIGTLPMGLIEGLPVGLGVIAKNGEDLKLVRAMAAIERNLGIGVLTPTFTR